VLSDLLISLTIHGTLSTVLAGKGATFTSCGMTTKID
jgi:hypothetical protein